MKETKSLKPQTGYLQSKTQTASITKATTNGQKFIKRIKISSQWTLSQSREAKVYGESKKAKIERNYL